MERVAWIVIGGLVAFLRLCLKKCLVESVEWGDIFLDSIVILLFVISIQVSATPRRVVTSSE